CLRSLILCKWEAVVKRVSRASLNKGIGEKGLGVFDQCLCGPGASKSPPSGKALCCGRCLRGSEQGARRTFAGDTGGSGHRRHPKVNSTKSLKILIRCDPRLGDANQNANSQTKTRAQSDSAPSKTRINKGAGESAPCKVFRYA